MSSPRWRLNNLYHIEDKAGRVIPFVMNSSQALFYRTMHYSNVILKARQLGFSTLIAMLFLDVSVFNPNTRCGIVDATIDDAKKKLAKIKLAYDMLPEWIREWCPLRTATAFKIEWLNGSSIEVGTSHRGGTLQYLHISELGKIAAKFPEKSREIRTGALNTVQAGQMIFVESTAEGQDGDFFRICDESQSRLAMSTPLTPLDFKFFFFAWWKAREYTMDPDGVVVTDEFRRYFKRLEDEHGVELTDGQKAWYIKKSATQLDDMKREYPSTPTEAFEASIEGAIFGPQLEAARREGRIGEFPAYPDIPVHTFWDIGRADYTSIWFAQVFAGKVRIVGFYQNCLTGMPHYAEECYGSDHARTIFKHEAFGNRPGLFLEHGWKRGHDVFPHDGKVIEWGSNRSRIEQLIAAGFKAQIGTELSLHDGINAARATIPLCEFDEAGIGKEGLKVLGSYRWEWDERRAAWRTGTPNHDTASHGADAFRTLGTSWRELPAQLAPKPTAPNKEILTALPDGRVVSNMSVQELVKLNKKLRLAAG